MHSGPVAMLDVVLSTLLQSSPLDKSYLPSREEHHSPLCTSDLIADNGYPKVFANHETEKGLLLSVQCRQ